MKKFEYIFLDLDGPILDNKLRHYNCYKDIILQDGGIPLNIDVYWDMKRNRIRQDVVLEYSKYCGSSVGFLRQWLESIEQKEYLIFDMVKPHVQKTLISWKNFTNRIVLITMRNNHENLLWQLQRCRVESLFDEIISCSSMKCDGGKYNVLKGMHFTQAILVGDTEEDTETAQKLGIKSIAITNGLREQKYLDADYYFREINEIYWEEIIT